MRVPLRLPFALAGLCLLAGAAGAAVSAVDDAGRTLRLAAPAQRIVSLAPHVTELLFAAGAGARIVGAVEFSDYPPAALEIPRVGDYVEFDLETIVALRPDLVISWISGNPAGEVAALRRLGLPLFETEPRRLEDIARTLRTFGALAGTAPAAAGAALAFEHRLRQLEARATGARPLRVFYQVWGQPLITVNGEHLISDVLRRCGARNVFADLAMLAPRIDVEAVLQADPQVIIGGALQDTRPPWLDDWRNWPELEAVRHGRLFFVPGTHLHRHTPRILDGMQRVCEQLESVRVGARQ